ncbi:MAG TPA: o-succinylbenzoate--CoA ligase [Candidatus Hydrogenedentes bacterium]|nr:o-succinylbenzoate--CoA ligase [Candidatus Hydrogenedentota bacterium]
MSASAECPLHAAARRAPNSAALVTAQRIFTYAVFDECVARVAGALCAKGVQQDSRVVIFEDRSAETAAVFPALWRLGAVACPIDARLPHDEVVARAEEAQATHILTRIPLNASIPIVSPLALYASGSALSEARVDPNIPATIVWTSGSTGRPKAAVHYLAQHWANARASNANLPLGPHDCWGLSLPLHHVSGLAILFRCWLAGATIALPDREATLVETISHMGVTHVSLVPAQLRRLLDVDEGRRALAGLKAILLGGGPLPVSILQEAEEAHLPVYATYGMTEMCSQIATTPGLPGPMPLRHPARPIIPGTVRIVPHDEIQVRGETLFAGYLTGGVVDLPLTQDGWFATGDVGRLDAQGHLYVTGRQDNMFVSGGENIHPEEIERALCRIEGVESAVVTPVRDRVYGLLPIAFVRMRNEAPVDARRLDRELRRSLPGYMAPRAFLSWPSEGEVGLKLDRAVFARAARCFENGWRGVEPHGAGE